MKPTIIGSGNLEGPKPTVIGSGNVSTSKLPTVIGSAVALPVKAEFHVSKPSVLPGAIRKRIPATIEDLRKIYPTKDSVLIEALRIIETTSQDDLKVGDAILWGQSLQQKHAALINESLSLAQSEVVTIVSRHMNRLMEILGNIQLEKIFSQTTGFLGNVLRKSSKEIDTTEELDQALLEIKQLSDLMTSRINELIALRQQLDSNAEQIDMLGDHVEASMLAALAVAEYFNQQLSRPDMHTCLQERAASLTVMLGQIRSNSSMRHVHIEQPTKLTTLIQNMVFNTLSSWMMSVTALSAKLRGHQQPNPTEVSEVSRVLHQIRKNH